MSGFEPLDIKGFKSLSIRERQSKVSRTAFAQPWTKGGRLEEFLTRLPGILAAGDFVEVVDRLTRAVQGGRTIILAMGGHPVKVGLSPIIIDLMKRGILSLVAVNGSVMVHDTEVAMIGSTSEDVGASLTRGDFGTGLEANELINAAAVEAAEKGLGLGRALGLGIKKQAPSYERESVFAAGVDFDIPITVHVALGTDVYHIHPEADGSCLGRASMHDFRTFCSATATLEGGVFINLGSAVIMPEVFLKAVSLVRNLGYSLDGLTTVNMDFIRHYRPEVNVVRRPTSAGGKGFNLTGHHELMLPLLAAALIEKLD